MITDERILELARKHVRGSDTQIVYMFTADAVKDYAKAIEAECQQELDNSQHTTSKRGIYWREKAIFLREELSTAREEIKQWVLLDLDKQEMLDNRDELLAEAQARIQELRAGLCELQSCHVDMDGTKIVNEMLKTLATTDNHAALDAAIEPYKLAAERYRWILNSAAMTDALWAVIPEKYKQTERHISNVIDEAIRARNKSEAPEKDWARQEEILMRNKQ